MLGGIVLLRKIRSWMFTNDLSFVGTLRAKYGSIFLSCQNLVIFWYEVEGKELLVNSKYAQRGNPVIIPVVSAMPSLVATYCIKEGSLTIISKYRWFNLWIRKCLPFFWMFWIDQRSAVTSTSTVKCSKLSSMQRQLTILNSDDNGNLKFLPVASNYMQRF